jgi:hypothetical protein
LSKPIIIDEKDVDTSIDAQAVLGLLTSRVFGDAASDQEKVTRWVRYVLQRMAGTQAAPMMSNGQMVVHPIALLRLRTGQCGQVNRVVVDGLLAAGYDARLVQLSGHVAAEVRYGGNWHFLDAFYSSPAGPLVAPDGTIPSTIDICKHLDWVDKSPPELRDAMHKEVFAVCVYPDLPATPFYWIKTAAPREMRNVYYGWNDYVAKPGELSPPEP